MNGMALIVTAIAVLPAFGLAVWIWLALASVNDELHGFQGFDGMHFDR